MTLTESYDIISEKHLDESYLADRKTCEALTICLRAIDTVMRIKNILENESPYEVESQITETIENFYENVEAE